MHYRKLGKSSLEVSVVGFGCWAIGGHKWGPIDDQQSVKAIHTALEIGVNFFDTADVYGLGHSEEILGKALASSPQQKKQPIIATKVGLRWNRRGKIFHDLSPDYVKKACSASLKRLNVDIIDLYQLHWPDPNTPLEETIAALAELKDEGKIRYAGFSNFTVEQMQPYQDLPWLVSYQGIFNLFNQEAKEEILPFCLQHNFGFIAYEPLSKGLLTGKYNDQPTFSRGDHRRYEPRFTSFFAHYQPILKKLTEIAASHNITVAQMSLALLLAEEGVTAVIPGIKIANQIQENALAGQIVGTPLLEELYEDVSREIKTVRAETWT